MSMPVNNQRLSSICNYEESCSQPASHRLTIESTQAVAESVVHLVCRNHFRGIMNNDDLCVIRNEDLLYGDLSMIKFRSQSQ